MSVKVFFGGQTVTLGKVISVIGLVSIVVFIGLSSQDLNEKWIRITAPVNPEITTMIQNSLTHFCLLAEI